MKIVFLSNFFSHHQKPFSDAMDQLTGGEYLFLETEQMPEERKKLGYQLQSRPSYLWSLDQIGEEAAETIVLDADVLIIGSAPDRFLQGRLRKGRLCFRYHERPLKQGVEPLIFFPRLVKWHKRNPMKQPLYMLCASAYTASDYARFGLFRNKCYKWGYFPPFRQYGSIGELLEKKEPNRILWCGRFLELKHPEDALSALRILKDDGFEFTLDFIGAGPMEEALHNRCEALDLTDRVRFLGLMSPDEVRKNMERSSIFLFTSDRREGWGAVLNEAMNSACAVIAARETGSAPYLIKHKSNGLLYSCGDIDALSQSIRYLFQDHNLQLNLGAEAYRTIAEEWNAEIAAARFLQLSETILADGSSPDLFSSGPCSIDDTNISSYAAPR